MQRCVITRYHASPWESWWAENIDSISGHWHPLGCDKLCEGSCSAAHVVNNKTHPLSIWLALQVQREEAPVVFDWRGHPLIPFFTVRDRCAGGPTATVPIEPLAGPLRHPYHDCVKHGSAAQRKDYLLPVWRIEVMPVPRRSFFFDCGASLYSSGSGGGSQYWFPKVYAKRSLAFDRVLAWEYTNHSDDAILRPLPQATRNRARIHRNPDEAAPGCCAGETLSYFNFGIDAEPGSHRNPLVQLRALASPDDFVVFKLDIDTLSIELAIVDQILADAPTAALIDEFYWEHVVSGSTMDRFGWGHDLRRIPPKKRQTLTDSYRYFRALRDMGIRAHSWV